MKPSSYMVGGKDSVGNTIKSILGKSDKAVVYTTENQELRWEYDDDGELPGEVQPAVRQFDKLMAQIRSSEMLTETKNAAYVLLGQCLFLALNASDPKKYGECFQFIQDFLVENLPQPTRHPRRGMRILAKLSWPKRVGLALVLVLCGLTFWAWIDAWLCSYQSVKVTWCEQKQESDELIVLVHGYNGSLEKMNGVIQAIHERRPNADIMFFSYPSSTWCNTDPFKVASQLDELINSHDQPKYKRIILAGHSAGALLVRKAYVYGCGNIEDLPIASGTVATRSARTWCPKVDRMVLLAGMNRGWNSDTRPDDMSWLAAYRNRFAVWLGRLSGTGRFIRHFERGEPFVANLRLQWLKTMADAKEMKDGLRPPVVIQLLGDRDDVVSKDDSRDVNVAREFIWVAVNNTGHASILETSSEGDGLERKRRIQRAFGDDAEIAALKQSNPVLATDSDPDVTTVVFVLHGIRDMGEWTSQFKQPLEARFAQQHAGTGDKIYVHRAAYGYFPMGEFLLWGDRQRNVRWFMDQITELRARFPRLKHIHFIGHSNGTYVLASALEKYQTLHVDRVVFAGSVVRRSFPWSKYKGRVEGVRNYVGSADWVVAWFPKLFELPGLAILNPDLGSAGYNGFEDAFVKDGETQFIDGGHGAALVDANVQSIVDFILDGKKTEVHGLMVKEHPGVLDLLSRLCWVVWIAIVAVIITLGWVFTSSFNGRLAIWLTPRRGNRCGPIRRCMISCLNTLSNHPGNMAPIWRGRLALGVYVSTVLYLLVTL